MFTLLPLASTSFDGLSSPLNNLTNLRGRAFHGGSFLKKKITFLVIKKHSFIKLL